MALNTIFKTALKDEKKLEEKKNKLRELKESDPKTIFNLLFSEQSAKQNNQKP